MQAIRVAAQARDEERRQRMIEAAFVGWQTAASFQGRGVGTFMSYLRRLGLTEEHKPSPRQIEAERRKAEDNIAYVKQAFARGAVRRQISW